MRDYKKDISIIKGTSYISSIPLIDFEKISDLETFVKLAESEGITVFLEDEQSNFYQGVLVSAFDNETCDVKEYVLPGRGLMPFIENVDGNEDETKRLHKAE